MDQLKNILSQTKEGRMSGKMALDQISNLFDIKESGSYALVGSDHLEWFTLSLGKEKLVEVCKTIISFTPGDEWFYSFSKFLWIQLPNGEEVRMFEFLLEDGKE